MCQWFLILLNQTMGHIASVSSTPSPSMASPTTSMASLFKEPHIRSRMTTRSCHGFTSQSRHTSLSPCRQPRTWCSLYGTQFVASSMTTRPRAPSMLVPNFEKSTKAISPSWTTAPLLCPHTLSPALTCFTYVGGMVLVLIEVPGQRKHGDVSWRCDPCVWWCYGGPTCGI